MDIKSLKNFKIASTALSVALLGAALSLAILPSANAELVATPLKGDSRLVQFQYDGDNTYLVLAKPKAVTHIQFAPDEVFTSVAAGDTSVWEVTPTKNRKNLFIKPKYEDESTSMTVLTDKRTYQFVLKSTGEGKKWYQRVSWLYNAEIILDSEDQSDLTDEKQKLANGSQASQKNPLISTASSEPTCSSNVPAIKPENMRFGYEIIGNAPFKPTMVFDDGKFTFYRMPESSQELPALFAVVDGKDYGLVNYTVSCDYLVAQRLIDTAVLSINKQEVRINKPKPKKGLFGFSTGD